VPVGAFLNDRLDPDDHVCRQNRGGDEMPLGSRFQAKVAARQVTESALHLFLYMRSDVTLGSRVDSEYASIRTAFDVPIHSASALVDGLLEDFGFPTVQECGVESVSGSVTVGEYERLLGVQGLPCERVEPRGIPVNLDLDLGKGDGVRRICALPTSCEGDVRFMVTGIKILSIPAAWERDLGTESTRTRESGESIVT